ncbi:MAG: A/G-specific adenine glycosylase [bacterium]|nr:A/G-specific adenine glycosylase [bacterium]
MTPKQFRTIIWEHYKANKRKNNFPWRKTHNPYHILVSEIMLQQTQIPRVIPKYNEWLIRFPTLKALSRAPFSKILKTWQGLGYNRRARFLKDTATILQKNHKGAFPRSPSELQKLPGVGHYTARAVACFSFGTCEPFLDTNIRRVYIHFFALRLSSTRLGANCSGQALRLPSIKLGINRSGQGKQKRHIKDAQLLPFIKRTEPEQNKREWYGALMDYGRDMVGTLKENPNKKSSTYAKQSPFYGSRRYMRAKIIRYLLSHKSAAPIQIKRALAQDPYLNSQTIQKQFSLLIASLKKERLIAPKKNLLTIRQH